MKKTLPVCAERSKPVVAHLSPLMQAQPSPLLRPLVTVLQICFRASWPALLPKEVQDLPLHRKSPLKARPCPDTCLKDRRLALILHQALLSMRHSEATASQPQVSTVSRKCLPDFVLIPLGPLSFPLSPFPPAAILCTVVALLLPRMQC